WANGAASRAGAATWFDGTTGRMVDGSTHGVISASNSLVGTQSDDSVGNGIYALTTGDYVVASNLWNNGGISGAGAVTVGSGTSGIGGTISAANSLVGTHSLDFISGGGVHVLTNGTAVVASPSAFNGVNNAGLVHVVSSSTGAGFTNPLTFADT